MFAALVISDIHFIRHRHIPTDVNEELRNGLLAYLPRVRKRFPDISLILVCGDVAYGGAEHQYAAAASFLREVQSGLGGARILAVPGNHDVDRPSTLAADQRNWRSSPRRSELTPDQRDQVLIELLEDDRSGPGLFEPLAAYNVFAGAYGCEISVKAPYWTVRVPINERYQAQIRGLTSVLISDEHDDSDGLLLGDVQVTDLHKAAGIVNLTLCHHPYSALIDGDRQRARLRHRSAVHITGHEHSHDVRVDPETATIHLCAGALQPTRNPDWEPRLYAIGIEVSETGAEASAQVDVVSAHWNRDADRFIHDVDERLHVPIDLPELGLQPPAAEPTAQFARLVERLAALQPADRLSAAAEIGADLGSLMKRPAHEFPRLLVAYAEHGKLLHELWNLVNQLHGGQIGETNPFGHSQ